VVLSASFVRVDDLFPRGEVLSFDCLFSFLGCIDNKR
jgi:hypothetical protein